MAPFDTSGSGSFYHEHFISQGEEDDTAMDINFSGNLSFDKIMDRYLSDYLHLEPIKLGDTSGETKMSGSLLKP